MKKFIIVSGNIGCGKSSLTDLLSKRLGWKAYYEVVENNPYLEDFYKDMGIDIVRRPTGGKAVLHDKELTYSFIIRESHPLVNNSILETYNRDYENYQELFNIMTQFLTPPDLIVYLQASVPTLLKRISLRGRDYEKTISEEYLNLLNVLYEEWIEDFSICPILNVPADDLDFVKRPEHLKLISNKILDKLQGVEKVIFD